MAARIGEGEVVVQDITRGAPTTAALMLVIDGSARLADTSAKLIEALDAIPPGTKVGTIIASEPMQQIALAPPGMFLPEQPSGSTGLARRLNGAFPYCAMRWNYDEYSKEELRDMRVLDLGGTTSFWKRAPIRPLHVTVINLARNEQLPWLRPIEGDALKAPDLVAADSTKQVGVVVLARDDILIPAQHARRRPEGPDLGFDPLGAGAEVANLRTGAGRTVGWRRAPRACSEFLATRATCSSLPSAMACSRAAASSG